MSKRTVEGWVLQPLFYEFCHALCYKKFDKCNEVLEKMTDNDVIQNYGTGRNVFMMSVYHGCDAELMVKLYRRWPWLLNLKDKNGKYAIHHAARQKNTEKFMFILRVSSQEMLLTRCRVGYLPLQYVFSEEKNRDSEIIKIRELLKRGGLDKEAWTAKYDHIQYSTLNYLKLVLKDPPYSFHKFDVGYFKHRRCVLNLFMMSYHDDDFEKESNFLQKFMHRCIENRFIMDIGSDFFMNILFMSVKMKKPSDIATPNKDRNFPLHLLCFSGNQF